MVVIGLPLDRIARAASASASPIGVRPLASVAHGSHDVAPRLARGAVEAAWRSAGLGHDDARLDDLVARARWSALLPETRLRAIRFEDQRLSTESNLDANRLRDSTSANLGLEARLTWRFDRLLYADDEPSFERMRLERHDARARIAGRVLETLFHWQRARLELRYAEEASHDARESSERPSRDEAEAAMRLMEAEATLDVLTSGWFATTRSQGEARRPPEPPSPTLPGAL